MNARIEGFLTARTPIHQTQPGVKGYVDVVDGRLRLSYSDKRKGECNVQMTSTYFDRDGRRHDVPIISGNSLRGTLRKAASRHLLRAIGPVRPELFQVISAGAYHRKDMGGERTADLLNGAAKNAFVGLFGGGGASLPSSFSSSDMPPVLQATEATFSPWVRDAALIRRAEVKLESGGTAASEYERSVTQIYATIRRDPMLAGEGIHFVYDHDKVYNERLAQILKDKADKQSGEGIENNKSSINLAMMSYVQAIVPGTRLGFSVLFRSWAEPSHFGLLMLALLDLVNEQAMAGASRRGYGRFEPTLRFYCDDLGAPVNVFEPVVNQGMEIGWKVTSEVEPYVDLARQALSEMSVAELEDLYIRTVINNPEEGDGPVPKRKKKG